MATSTEMAEIALSSTPLAIFKAQISYLESTLAFLLACSFCPSYLIKPTLWLKNSHVHTAEPAIKSNSSGPLSTKHICKARLQHFCYKLHIFKCLLKYLSSGDAAQFFSLKIKFITDVRLWVPMGLP